MVTEISLDKDKTISINLSAKYKNKALQYFNSKGQAVKLIFSKMTSKDINKNQPGLSAALEDLAKLGGDKKTIDDADFVELEKKKTDSNCNSVDSEPRWHKHSDSNEEHTAVVDTYMYHKSTSYDENYCFEIIG